MNNWLTCILATALILGGSYVSNAQPSFTTTAATITPSTASPGQTVTLNATVRGNNASSAINIDLEVRIDTTKYAQQFFSNQSFTANQSRNYSMTYTLPANLAPGDYCFTTAAFNSNWTTAYMWNQCSAHLTVSGTPPPPPPVNGACGSANGQSFSSAPTTNLCSAGQQTAPMGSGPWTWGCLGSNGGTNATCSAQLASGPIASPIPPEKTTLWNPGILEDTPLNQPLGDDGLPVRTTVCATVNPGTNNIQAAIDACPPNQVVKLNPGTFNVATTVHVKNNVVLRGSGSNGASAGGTTINKTGGGPVVDIGQGRDGTCYSGSMGTPTNLTQNGVKESFTVNVAPGAGGFVAGDIALIDLTDEAGVVVQGDCTYFKRASGRSLAQRVEIKTVNNGVLTLSSPLHWNFTTARQAQITRVTQPTIRWAGVESFKIQGGSNTGYNGQMAGGVDVSNAAYCWVKDIQTGGGIAGMHVRLGGTYRCVVRDSYIHHSGAYNFAADSYGIVPQCGAAENLVENNIVRYMNKPIMLDTTGGGNVFSYNYADNSWSDGTGTWQESPFDCHCSFPHMELIEGNQIPHMAANLTHGNAGYLTFFRNYASHQFASPAVFGQNPVQNGNVGAVNFGAGDIGMNVVGNVLGSNTSGTTAASGQYENFGSGNPPAIYRLGGANDVSRTTLFRTENFDYFNNSVVRVGPQVTLPPSLFRTTKPAWWPAGQAWPNFGPDLTPMLGTLPAKARSDANYNPSVP